MNSRHLSVFFLLFAALAPLFGQKLPELTPEHHALARFVGTWDAVIESVGADGALHRSKGVSVRTLGPGGYWVLEDFQGEMNGVHTTGHGALGYDPQKKAWVQSWVSMAPMLMMSSGSFDPSGKVLTMVGKGPSTSGAPLDMKNVTTWTGADSMTLEVFVVMPDGTETRFATVSYTRRVEKTGAK